MTVAEESILVNAPVAEVYRRWSRFEELPKFIKTMHDVRRIDDTHFSFCAANDGEQERRVAEVMFRNPERRLAWRTVANGVGLAVVSFEPHPSGATEITLKLRCAIKPFQSPNRATEYLREFKKLIETSASS